MSVNVMYLLSQTLRSSGSKDMAVGKHCLMYTEQWFSLSFCLLYCICYTSGWFLTGLRVMGPFKNLTLALNPCLSKMLLKPSFVPNVRGCRDPLKPAPFNLSSRTPSL